MVRKQTDYLADILQDAGDDSSAPTDGKPDSYSSALTDGLSRKRTPSPLIGRQSALARVASGEVRQITQLQLDPGRVRIWPGNPRIQAKLTEISVADLIQSIIAEGGLKVAVVVRRLQGDPDFDYELIVGTRRHFAISWLRANHYPDMRLLAQVVELDDEAAFRFADVENRARADISDIERARNYRAALSTHYGGQQVRMAERLRISKGWLSKMLRVAAIPDDILEAFSSLTDLTLKPAYQLAVLLDEPARSAAILETAKDLAAEQKALLSRTEPSLSGSEILRRLLSAGLPDAPAADLYVGESRLGRPALSVSAKGRQGLTIRVHAASGATGSELQDLFRAALRHHGMDGKGR